MKIAAGKRVIIFPMDALEAIKVAMWIILISTALVTVAYGAILYYHWTRYSGDTRVTSLTLTTYTGVSIVLILCMLGSIPV